MTVRDTQMVHDQKKFENHCYRRLSGDGSLAPPSFSIANSLVTVVD